MQNPVPVPLPLGINAAVDFPKSRERLVNLMAISERERVPRPGIKSYATGFGKCRGSEFYRKLLFQASGERVAIIQRDPAAPVQDIGEIRGADLVFFAPGHTMMMILARGGQLLKWENTGGNGTLTDVSDAPNFLRSVDMAFIDGRWLYVPADGSPVFYSEVGDGANIQPGNFFDAELLPDDNLGIINVRNTIYVLGEQSIELFRATGQEDAPFRRVQGGQIQSGYISARIEYGPSFAYIGRNVKGHAGIFYAGQGEAIGISNDAVGEILNSYSRDELYLARSQRYTWRGQDVVAFTLPNQTVAYANGQWHILTSEIEANETENQEGWRAVDAEYAYGRYIVGDIATGDIGELTDVSTEYDEQIAFEFLTYVRNTPNSQMVIRAAELDTRAGLVPTLKDPTFIERLETHVASQWQIATDQAFTNIVFDTGDDAANLTNFQFTDAPLTAGTQYWWRVRYKGEVTNYSDWSTPTSFTTVADAVNQPYGVSPADQSTGIVPEPTLTASTFLAVGTPDTHQTSQWQVATDPGFANIVFDSGVDAVNLESITLPSALDLGTIYYWRVAYAGTLSTSPFSVPLQFTTVTAGVQAPANVRPAQNEFNVVNVKTLFLASNFIDINLTESHEASQWQVATDQFFTDIVLDSGEDTTNLTTYTSTIVLNLEATYFWRVRYKGNVTGFGPYSAPTSFTTEGVPEYARVTTSGAVRIVTDGNPRVTTEDA